MCSDCKRPVLHSSVIRVRDSWSFDRLTRVRKGVRDVSLRERIFTNNGCITVRFWLQICLIWIFLMRKDDMNLTESIRRHFIPDNGQPFLRCCVISINVCNADASRTQIPGQCNTAPRYPPARDPYPFTCSVVSFHRISMIFSVGTYKRVRLPDQVLVQRLVGVILAAITVLAAWTGTSTPEVRTLNTSDGLKFFTCNYGAWEYSVIGGEWPRSLKSISCSTRVPYTHWFKDINHQLH